jgi:hypothetical protein
MFQKLCDPLLANSANYQSISKKSYLVNKMNGAGLKAGGATNKHLDSSGISEFSSPRGVNRRGSTVINRDNLNQPSVLGFLPGAESIPTIFNNDATESTYRKQTEVKRHSGAPGESMLPDDDPVRFL